MLAAMGRTPRRTVRKQLRVHGKLAKRGRRRRVHKNVVAARKRTVAARKRTVAARKRTVAARKPTATRKRAKD
jgi:hypothetical protein